MRNRYVVGLLGLVLCSAPAAAQDVPQSLRFSGLELTLGGRVQTQLNTTSMDDQPPSQLIIRRARLELAIRVSEYVSGTINPDFAGDEVDLKDAYLQLDLDPALRVLAGKMHRPFSLLEQTSSKRMPVVERGLRIRGLDAADEYVLTSGLDYSDRDIGVQLAGAPQGAPLGLSYAAGVFRGPLHGEVGPQDSYQFVARLMARPHRLLRVGAGWSSRDFIASADEVPELERGHAFALDVEYGAFGPGFHLLAEAAQGDLDPVTGADFRGAQAWLAYRTQASGRMGVAIEPTFRVSHGDPDDTASVPGGTLFTPGVNIYFGPLNRIMLNYDVWRGADGSQDANSFKAMFQLAF